MFEDPRWEKLPRWAQDQYNRAVRDAEESHEAFLALVDTDAPVQVETGSIPRAKRIGFKRHSTVYFRIGPRERDEIYMLIDQDNCLRVYAHGRLKVVPQASNCVHLETDQ
jgi:hypothetical protein